MFTCVFMTTLLQETPTVAARITEAVLSTLPGV